MGQIDTRMEERIYNMLTVGKKRKINVKFFGTAKKAMERNRICAI